MKKIAHLAAVAMLALIGAKAQAQFAGPPPTPPSPPAAAKTLGCLIASCATTDTTGIPGLNNALLQTSAIQTMLDTSNAVAARFAGPGAPRLTAGLPRSSSMAGGDTPALTVWASYTAGRQSDNHPGQDVRSNIDTTAVGADFALRPNVVLGITATADSGDGKYNPLDTHFDSRGYSVAPYVGWQISSDWLFDATLGWGSGKIDHRNSVGNGHAESDRFFAGVNLTYTTWQGNWQWTAKASHLYAEEKYGTSTFTATPATKGFSNTLNQSRLGVQLGYAFGNTIPYVGFTYLNENPSLDAAPGKAWDKTAWVGTAGVNCFSADGRVYGGAAYTSESRAHSDNHALSVNLGLRF